MKKLWRRFEKQYGDRDGFYLFAGEAPSFGKLPPSVEKGGLRPFLRALLLEYRGAVSPDGILQAMRREKLPISERELGCFRTILAEELVRLILAEPESFEAGKMLLIDAARLEYPTFYRAFSEVDHILRRQDGSKYADCDEQTQGEIRGEVARLARQKHLSDTDAAALYIRGVRPRRFPGWGYFALWGAGTLLLTAGGLLLFGWWGVLTLLPFSELAMGLTGWLLTRFLPARTLPRLALTEIPPEARTLVVITTLLSGKDEALFRRLETMRRQNRDENVCFGILADLPDSPTPHQENDEAILSAAVREIEALNERFGGGFYLFQRPRRKMPGEGLYTGWERKRGALLELCRLLRGKEDRFETVCGDRALLSSFRFVFTLDADTDLHIGAVREAVAAMLHPDNRPTVRAHRVVKGYGILQPRMSTSLAAAGASPFSVMLSGCGGRELYGSAGFDLYETLFDRGIYCGKGIFDPAVYLEVLDGALPENRILSHDLPEGILLRAGALTQVTLTDGCPRSPFSYLRRLHRWTRGDLQSLPLLFSICRGFLDRFFLLEGLRRALLPLATVIGIGLSLFLPKKPATGLLLALLSPIFLPLAEALIAYPGRIFRRFYSTVLEGCWHSLCEGLYRTVTLFHTAWVCADALLRVLWRGLISHKKRLEWVTAANAEQCDRLGGACRKMLPSMIAGLGLTLFAPYPLHKLLGLGFFFCPFLCVLLGQPYPAERTLREDRAALLRRWARDSFGFFARTVTAAEHFLPPDNLQELPDEKIAHRTSPTNIGLYLLSLLAATDLGILSEKSLGESVGKTLATLRKLPKYEGLLYNWYDTRTLEVVGTPYLSSVDCGNYLACLSALTGGLREHGFPALAEETAALEKEANLRLLWNPRRELFCISYDPTAQKQSENCYDLLMSESRILSYYAIARGIAPKKHWERLGKPLIGSEGHIGLAAYSGTAFEFFMPPLLLPVLPGSLLYEAMGFALFEQAKDACHELWGRSESGYFAFDADLNYQYRAFGAPGLALAAEPEKQQVLAPYAAALALCSSFSMPIKVLEQYEKRGFYGKYGFYEAVDFTPSRVGGGHAVIRSYMAHHTGMLLCAFSNAVTGGNLHRYFMRDGDMAAAEELLCEKIPVDAPVRPLPKREPKPIPRSLPHLPAETISPCPEERFPDTVLVGGKFRVLADGNGSVLLSCGDKAVSYPDPDGENRLHLWMSFDRDEPIDLLRGEGSALRCDGETVTFTKTIPEKAIRVTASFLPAGEEPYLAVKLEAEGDFKEAAALLSFTPVLWEEKGYLSHPAFHALQLRARYDPENRLLFLRHGKREPGEDGFSLGITRLGGKPFDFVTERMKLPPESSPADWFSTAFSHADGAMPDPILALRLFEGEANGHFSDTILLGGGSEEAALEKALAALRREKEPSRRFAEAMHSLHEKQLLGAALPASGRKYENLLLSRLLHPNRFPPTERGQALQSELWRHGISGEEPIVLLRLREEGEALPVAAGTILSGFLRTHKYLALKGFRFDLVLLCGRGEPYSGSTEKQLRTLFRETNADGSLNRRGGVHLLPPEAAEAVAPYAMIDATLGKDSIFETLLPLLPPPRKETVCPPTLPDHSDGRFTPEGYFLRKGKDHARRPFSFLYAAPHFGCIVNERSIGESWAENAALFPLTKSERLLLTREKGSIDLAAYAKTVRFGFGEALWNGEWAGLRYRLRVGVDTEHPVKVLLLELENETDAPIPCSLRYEISPHLGGTPVDTRDSSDGCTRFFRAADSGKRGFGAFLYHPTDSLTLKPHGKKTICFLLGMIDFRHDRSYYECLTRFGKPDGAAAAFARYLSLDRPETVFRLSAADEGLCELFNRYLPYQTKVCRLYARRGPDQIGGAYGFRDQLQDCMNLVEREPALLREQILRCAARQYYAGDVQHWWHPSPFGEKEPGIRSRCGDDLLWLPLAIALYLRHTGDRSILETALPYLDSPPLEEDERERYEVASVTDRSETLYAHGLRAIEQSLSRRGKTGLPLMGSCDWNDGLSHIGGRDGESVFTGMLLLAAIRAYLPYCTAQDAQRLKKEEAPLLAALETFWHTDRYARGRDAGGNLFGIGKQLDLLPQAFAGILGLPHADTAMETALGALYDEKTGLLRLLTPPYTEDSKPFPGYIAAYAPGLRENGGQYTHAALFGVLGLWRLGKAADAFHILRGLLPDKAAENPAYGGEPYAIAADRAAADGCYGRCGWTHYTGSAGWALAILTREAVGYRETPEGFRLSPSLTDEFSAFTLEIERGTTHYTVNAVRGEKDSLLLDGTPLPPDTLLPFDGKRHRVEVVRRLGK